MGSTSASSMALTVAFFLIAIVLILPFLIETVAYRHDQEATFRFVAVFLLIVIAWGSIF